MKSNSTGKKQQLRKGSKVYFKNAEILHLYLIEATVSNVNLVADDVYAVCFVAGFTLKSLGDNFTENGVVEKLYWLFYVFHFYKMSCNYADGLSPYHDKGQLGLEEKFDCKSVVTAKVSLLTKWVNEAKHIVIHTGAGISTSAGIPDFRGPRGVWTLQAKGEKPDISKEFNEAVPTITHMAIMKLVEKEKVKYVVSQNIDGLHLRSNLQRKYLSELHGNMFTEQCSSCNRQFVRKIPVPTVGQKSLNKPCPVTKSNGRPCRGKLHDTILDWEHNLPENDLGMADYHSCLADLSICLGTTMQIVPSGNLPLYTKKLGGKLVIVNLQPTKHDRKADLIIHAYVDEVMTLLMKNLRVKIPKYSTKNDPTRSSEKLIEWTISDYTVKKMKKIYEEKCGTKEARKRLEILDDDLPLSITKACKRKVKEEEDSDLEVLDVIVKPKKCREGTKRGSKKNSSNPAPVFNTTITIKKVTAPPASKKCKYEPAEKITIKKNVTPTKTKYEIVTKPKKVTKCEIVYTDSDLCNDLDMTCESDDDEMTNNFTYNFRRYLYEDVKKEEKDEKATETKTEIKKEVKIEEDQKTKREVKEEIVEKKIGQDKSDDEKEMETSLEKPNEVPQPSKGTADTSEVGKSSEELNPEKAPAAEGSSNGQSESTGPRPEDAAFPVPEEPGESTPVEIDSDKPEEISSEATSKSNEGNEGTRKAEEKPENAYGSLESEISNLENQMDEMVGQEDAPGFENSLTIPTCNINTGINENYEFYNSEYNSTSNPLDYVDSNYYNNF